METMRKQIEQAETELREIKKATIQKAFNGEINFEDEKQRDEISKMIRTKLEKIMKMRNALSKMENSKEEER